MPLQAPSTASAFIQWAAPGGAALTTTLTSLNTWSISFWVQPQAGAANRSIFHGGNSGDTTNLGIYINTTSSGAEFRVQLHNAAGTAHSSSSTATTGGATRPINTSAPWSWNLVTVRHKNNSGTSSDIQIIATGQNGTTYLGANTNYNPATNPLLAINFARLGKASPTGPISMQGAYCGLVVRNHDTTQAEHEALYATASPGRLLNYSSGVNWNNTTGLQWGIANTMGSHPTAQDAGTATAGLPSDWSTQSVPAAGNIFIFDRAAVDPTPPNNPNASFFDVYPTATTLSGTWSYTPVDDTRFPLNTPSINNGVSVAAPSAHFLPFAESTLPSSNTDRILFVGNSRGMRQSADKRIDTDLSGGNDAFGAMPQYWGIGPILERLPIVGGTFAVAPSIGTNIAAFGMSYDGAARASSSTTNVNNNRALRRFGYGSNSVGSTISGSEKTGGPGESVQIATTGYYQTLTNEVTGSLYTFDSPRSYQVTLLAYPTSSPATLSLRSSTTSRSDTSATSRAANSEVILDTTRGSATIASESGLAIFTIPSVGANDPLVGDAFVVRVGSTYDVSIVEAINYIDAGANIEVTLEHAVANLGTLAGTTAYWGPWGFETLAISATGLEGWATDAYQGFRVTAGTGTGPVVVLAEAWGTTDPSYWVGSSGWSGNGYTIHIVNAFTTERASDGLSPWTGFFRALAPDCVIVVPAQQNAVTSSIGSMTDSIRDAISTCEVIWMADHIHGRSDTVTDTNPLGDQDYSAWFEWMEDNAATYEVAYIAEPAHALGSFTDQMIRGWRSNSTAHDTSEGVRIWAAEALSIAATLLTEVVESTSSATDFLARLYSRARGFIGRLRV